MNSLSKVPLHVKCDCGNILEAPLMDDAKGCCQNAVKNLCLDHLKAVFKERVGRSPTMEEMIPYILAIDATFGDMGAWDGPDGYKYET